MGAERGVNTRSEELKEQDIYIVLKIRYLKKRTVLCELYVKR